MTVKWRPVDKHKNRKAQSSIFSSPLLAAANIVENPFSSPVFILTFNHHHRKALTIKNEYLSQLLLLGKSWRRQRSKH